VILCKSVFFDIFIRRIIRMSNYVVEDIPAGALENRINEKDKEGYKPVSHTGSETLEVSGSRKKFISYSVIFEKK
jgi:hypothetical protein